MNKLLSLVFCLTVIFFSGCATNTPNYLHHLTGSYVGQLVSNGSTIPVKTDFFEDKNGVKYGKYLMTEPDGVEVTGTLDEFKQEGPYTLLASWHDKYGSGKLRMLFSTQQLSFTGIWGLTSDGTLSRWDGLRVRDK